MSICLLKLLLFAYYALCCIPYMTQKISIDPFRKVISLLIQVKIHLNGNDLIDIEKRKYMFHVKYS